MSTDATRRNGSEASGPSPADASAGGTSPWLTVAIVAGPRRERAAKALASVLAQAIVDHLEVVLVEDERSDPLPGSDHPAVRTIRVGFRHFGKARAMATAAARAPVVAFLEEHARALPGWAEALVLAHRGPWAGVGYEVHNANPGSGRSDVQGLMSYGPFAPPLARGESRILSGHNSSYKREVLLSFGDRLGDLLIVDNVLQRLLVDAGHRLFLEPDAKIAHANEVTASGATRGYLAFHRAYGATRAREGRWSLLRRAAYVLLAPAIPVYYIAHTSRSLVRRRSPQLGVLVRNLPYVYYIQLVAALAQAAGLAFGMGESARRFSEFEVSEPRPARGGSD